MRFGTTFLSSVLMLLPIVATAESTISQPITNIQYDALDDNLWLIGAPWGAPSCPNATYIRITNAVPGRKQLLSIALAAKLAGQNVQFAGSCHTDPAYFNAAYIFVN